MTKKEKEKLKPIINAADNIAEAVEKASADEEQVNPNGKVDINTIKGLTATMKELTAIIRNVNELPTRGEKEAEKATKNKIELEKARTDREQTVKEINVIIRGAENWDG